MERLVSSVTPLLSRLSGAHAAGSFTHDFVVRALGRFRWLLPAIAVPVAVTGLGLGVQALAFERPARGTLFATEALRELVRFRAMRATERLGSVRVRSLCVEGWFHARDRQRLRRGALVLLSDGTRMYDLGRGIKSWDGIPAGPLNQRRFLLAGCPHAFDERLASALVHGGAISVTPVRVGGRKGYALRLAGSRLGFVVSAERFRPVEVFLGPARSLLTTAKAAPALRVVRRAFGLRPPARRHRG
jgi:hypothetical protein